MSCFSDTWGALEVSDTSCGGLHTGKEQLSRPANDQFYSLPGTKADQRAAAVHLLTQAVLEACPLPCVQVWKKAVLFYEPQMSVCCGF